MPGEEQKLNRHSSWVSSEEVSPAQYDLNISECMHASKANIVWKEGLKTALQQQNQNTNTLQTSDRDRMWNWNTQIKNTSQHLW